MAAWLGLPPLRPAVIYPRLLGYCNVGRVLESGDAHFAPGDRVLSFTSHCSHFLLRSDRVLLRLDPTDSADTVVCSYLYHLAYNAVLRSCARAGSRVLVIGLGALGLTSVAIAALAGAEVAAISDQPAPAALALKLGAEAVFTRAEERETAAWARSGADVVISTVNGWKDWQRGLRHAGQNGVIAMLGFPGRGEGAPTENPLASEHVYMKQLRIEAVGWSPESNDSRGFLRFNERDNLAWIVRQIRSGRIDPLNIVSGRFAGTDLASAYAALAERHMSPVTYLLDWKK